MARWRVVALPWRVDREEPPVGHPIIATYFHFNDIRQRWTHRVSQLHFLAIGPDPGLVRGRSRTTVILCERDEPMLHNIEADLARLLPRSRFRIQPKIVRASETWLAARRSATPVLFSPRLWGELSAAARSKPNVYEARFVFEPKDLEGIGATLGLSPREGPARQPLSA